MNSACTGFVLWLNECALITDVLQLSHNGLPIINPHHQQVPCITSTPFHLDLFHLNNAVFRAGSLLPHFNFPWCVHIWTRFPAPFAFQSSKRGSFITSSPSILFFSPVFEDGFFVLLWRYPELEKILQKWFIHTVNETSDTFWTFSQHKVDLKNRKNRINCVHVMAKTIWTFLSPHSSLLLLFWNQNT